ncbi:GNAT family N-acetyltransferase [Alteromonas sp. C1M14]|uniref:GNAT family N-acetyltransferase n=1 Tax=Alteromonas sp. C1M14 TaxID=2841567 RepID=UPI001C09168B|nr:GNAT family N-acetyltransferase [Alteromonas sp. C1M14]MBU2977561.1 GNAT family N-acetyltransferase [Alteromonas sp. C1M14]
MINWQCLDFTQLTPTQLYAIIQARINVFVVEQTCPYPELDGKDTLIGVKHLLGTHDNKIVAYARLLPPGVSYPSVSIGRVLTDATCRGQRLGYQLMEQALHQCENSWPGHNIEIGAQAHLTHFYGKFGFTPSSAPYLEDDIPHIDMTLVKADS